MVCELARAAGRSAVCESVAKPDYSLEDHWNERDARQAIARGWDVVVLQQGPSALTESRVLLVDYAKRFDAEIRKTGARTALYMVWPSRTRRGDFPGRQPVLHRGREGGRWTTASGRRCVARGLVDRSRARALRPRRFAPDDNGHLPRVAGDLSPDFQRGREIDADLRGVGGSGRPASTGGRRHRRSLAR